MKKLISLIPCLLALILLAGCSQNSAEEYVGEQITSMKEKDTDNFTALLEDGIAESNESFILQFPEELREPYPEFMQNSFKAIKFEVSKSKKLENGNYSVQLTYTPINISDTLKSDNTDLLASLETADLTEAASTILKEDAKILADSPVYDDEILSTLDVTKEGDTYSITSDSMNTFLSHALHGYMEPYNMVCDILNTYDFINAYLDASFKGEVTQFAKHTDRTEEEALAWYEEDVFDPPSDMSEAYIPRYKEALKTILKQCQYTVGIPHKESGIYSYTVDITTTPNHSFADAYAEFEQGTYYSIEEASAGLVQAMEKYAAAPTYGEETTVNVPISTSSLLDAGNDNSELTNLATTILVAPQ